MCKVKEGKKSKSQKNNNLRSFMYLIFLVEKKKKKEKKKVFKPWDQLFVLILGQLFKTMSVLKTGFICIFSR